MKKIVGLVAIAAFAVSAPALAKEPGWYVGAGIGSTKFKADVDLDGQDNEVKDDSLGGTLIAGYQMNKYFAWEGELQFSGEAKDSLTIDQDNDITTKFNYNNWAIGVVGMLPFANRFTVFGRALATYGKAELKASGQEDGNSVSEKQTFRDGGYVLGVGGSVQFGPVDLRLRYDYQRVRFDNKDDIDEPTRIGLDALWRF